MTAQVFEQDPFQDHLRKLNEAFAPAVYSEALVYRRAGALGEVAAMALVDNTYDLDPHLAREYVDNVPFGAKFKLTALGSSDASIDFRSRVSLVSLLHEPDGTRRGVLTLGLPLQSIDIGDQHTRDWYKHTKTFFSTEGTASYYPLFGGNTEEGLQHYHQSICTAATWVQRILRRQINQAAV